MIRRSLGGFRIHGRIGLGSTAVVWLAEKRHRVVALKELHPHLTASTESTNRFEREARIASQFEHPNVVRVLEFGRDDARWYIAFEHVDGADIRQLLNESGPLGVEGAVAVTLDLLDGLAYAHSRGVTHRDVKPANILVSRDGVAKIADFSIARNDDLPAMTMTGALVGTPAYMSPEQVWGREVDSRCDLYSTGIVLFEMLVGRRPHNGATSPEFLTRNDPPEVPDWVPAPLASVLSRAMQTDPADRFGSALEFREALLAASRSAGIVPDRAGVVRRVSVTMPEMQTFEASTPSFRPAAYAGLALCAVIAIAVTLRPSPSADTLHAAPITSFAAVAKAKPIAKAGKRVEMRVAARVPKRTALAGAVTINATPGADVWLDGMYVGPTPLWSFPVSGGAHDVRLRNAGCETVDLELHVDGAVEKNVHLRCGKETVAIRS